MNAVLYDHYGPVDVLQVREVDDPRPRRGQVLVRVRAAALNPKDVLVRRGKFALLDGWRFPKRVGYDWAGEVVALGASVREPAIGARVFGMLGGWAGGTCAELVAADIAELAVAPSAVPLEEAAAIPLAALTSLQALRDVAALRRGEHITIHGASGGVGLFAIQIAKHLGGHVTTTSSDANRALCTSLGADVALDHRVDCIVDPARRCDLFFDVFGNQSFAKVQPMLAHRGTYVTTVPKPHVFARWIRTIAARQRCRLVVVRSRARDLGLLAQWVDGGVLRPVIDSTYPLDAIADAQARVETRHARGKVVVTITGADLGERPATRPGAATPAR